MAQDGSRGKMAMEETDYYSDSSTCEEEQEDDEPEVQNEQTMLTGSVKNKLSDGIEGGWDNSCAATRSSVKYVVAAVSKFDEKKKTLVKEIGFDGILEIPQINKVSRGFTVWLLRNLDPNSRTIVVDGEEVVDMVDMDVNRILGIPSGGKVVTGLKSDDQKSRKKFLEDVLGAQPTDKNSLVAAGRIINKTYEGEMSKEDCDHFKVAFVIFVVGHLLAPTTKNNVGNSSFWGALENPDDISKFNWGEYVIENTIDAAIKVQSDINTKQKVCNITGCSIFLQILYLDSIRVPGIDRARHLKPRIKAYNCQLLKQVIEADQANSSSGSSRRSWGTNLKRNAASQGTASTNHDYEAIQTMSKFNMELGKFIKESFDGQLNQTQLDAIKVYGSRCSTHFETLKSSLMKENLVLLEFLLTSARQAPSKPERTNIRTNVRTVEVQARRGQKRTNDTIQNTSGHCYESADEGYVLRRKPRTVRAKSTYSTPETILSGGGYYPKQSATPTEMISTPDITNQHSLPKQAEATSNKETRNISGVPEAPSFDLGIEDEEIHQKDGTDVAQQQLAVVAQTDQIQAEPEQSCKTTEGQISGTIEHDFFNTPVTSKLSSGKTKWSTPDNRLGSSTVSPSSMSKILAGCEIMGRVLLTEEEVNLNLKPYDDEVTESPVVKQVVGQYKLAKSPWFYDLKHSTCSIEQAKTVMHKVTSCPQVDLQRTWVAHRVPRYLEVSGLELAQAFSGREPMSYNLFDLAIRRLVQLDDVMYKNCGDRRWRHILESDFSVLSQANENPSGMKSIRDQFFSDKVDYMIHRCRMIVVPVQVLKDWCCYFWDFKKRRIQVLDPFYNDSQSEFFIKKHDGIVKKIGEDVAKCIELFFDNWSVEWDKWQTEYAVPLIKDLPINESVFATLLSIREWDGERFRNINKDEYENFKLTFLTELLRMDGNQVKKIPIGINMDQNLVYQLD